MRNFNFNSPVFLMQCIFFIAVVSCNNQIEIDPEDAEKMIVVDGWIEAGEGPNVMLTWNMPYIAQLDSESIRQLVIRNASVFVSDCTQTEGLTLQNNKNYFPPYVYRGFDIIGKPGVTYYLQVKLNNNLLNTKTTIPNYPLSIDTCWYSMKPGKDSSVSVYMDFTDEMSEKNYYRIFSKVGIKEIKSKKYYPVLFSTFDDRLFQQSKNTIEINKGPESYINYELNIDFLFTDTITIKLSSIDQNSYHYWQAYQSEVLSIGNPFASSFISVPNYIQGNGIGIWCGYASKTYTIYGKKQRPPSR